MSNLFLAPDYTRSPETLMGPDQYHRIWTVNPDYASAVQMRMVPITYDFPPTSLELLVAYPLLNAAQILNNAGYTTVNSSPFEDRGEDGVWAYIIVPESRLLDDFKIKKAKRIASRYKDTRSPRFRWDDLPSMYPPAPQGLYLEVEITPETTHQQVNDELINLAREITKLTIEA